MKTWDEVIKQGKTSTENALQIFDRLEPVDPDFMIGIWKGSGFPTNHRLDGLLEATGWYGKAFVDADKVHPLLFRKTDQKGVFALDPGFLPLAMLNLPVPKNSITRLMLLMSRPLLQTKKYRARLRMVEYRGKYSASMIYDNKPIIDIFRKVDNDKVLGLMDLKGMEQPFFFILQKQDSDALGGFATVY